MSLLAKLTDEMKIAMKARDTERLTTLRGLMAEIKKMAIDTGKEMTADDEISFLTTQAKRRREAIDAFAETRPELADKERAELAVIESYLPTQLTPEEAADVVRAVVERVGATSKKDLGKVMGPAMAELKGRFPGKDVKSLVESLLDG